MANFDDFKQKALDAMGTIADVSVEVYKIAEEKAKTIAKTTKLNAEITREKTAIRRLYTYLGKKYYELHCESPEDALSEFCTDIKEGFVRIEAKRAELEALKVAAEDVPDVEIDIPDDIDEKENTPDPEEAVSEPVSESKSEVDIESEDTTPDIPDPIADSDGEVKIETPDDASEPSSDPQ